MNVNANGYETAYSATGFWAKIKDCFLSAGRTLVQKACEAYYVAIDPDTPMWAKTAIFAALGYFISPIDIIPDAIPVLGWSDDLVAVGTALKATVLYCKDEHRRKAAANVRALFGG